MDDELKIESDMLACEAEARQRYTAHEPYQSVLASQYRIFHHYFAPPQYNWGSGDQWPEDRQARPERIHVTANTMRTFLTVGARLESILPRVTIPSSTLPEEERRRAEGAEQIMMTWLELSGWDTWFYDFALTKAIYGKGILKPYWNEREKRGDVYVIESPWNLRIGYGASDFHTIDWALYEYSLSVQEVKRRYPKLHIETSRDSKPSLQVTRYAGHEDPIDQRRDDWAIPYREPSQYERMQARVWDYWYRDEDENICNAVLVEGTCAEGPVKHPELLDIPYIVAEHDHEPGSPEGVSGAIDLIDLQVELNRAYSHMFQYVADNVDPAWFLTGPDAAAFVEGLVPKAGEVVSTGESTILEVPKGQSTVPFTEVVRTVWEAMHRISGVPEIALGGLAGSDISGRATAVQIQSHLNRMDPRRNRTYNALKRLLRFWVHMAEEKNPKPLRDRENGVGDLVRGFQRWRIVPPEITPRDISESVTTETNKLNARVQSYRTTMDSIGIENPEAELKLIREEGMDAALAPERTQAYVSLMTMMAQLQQQMAMMQQQAAMQGGAAPGGQDPQAQAQAALAQVQQQQFQAQPTGFEDQNEAPPQPATQAGMPPPAGGQGPEVTTLIRQGQPLNQLAYSSGGA